MNRKTSAAFGVSFLFLVGVNVAQAAPVTEALANIGLGNTITVPYTTNVGTIVVQDTDSTGAPASVAYATGFSGLNSNGDAQFMAFTGQSKAQSAYGTLKASSSFTLTTPYANTANPNYVTDIDSHVNPAGVPTNFFLSAKAGFQDVLSLAADSTVSTLRITLNLTGTIDKNTPDAITGSDVVVSRDSSYGGVSHPIYYSSYTNGTYDVPITIDLTVTDPNAIFLSLYLSVDAAAYIENPANYDENTDYHINVDFFHTLDLTAFEALDANGNTVKLNSIVGQSGNSYFTSNVPTPGVPEPATLAMFAFGAFGLTRLRRKSA